MIVKSTYSLNAPDEFHLEHAQQQVSSLVYNPSIQGFWPDWGAQHLIMFGSHFGIQQKDVYCRYSATKLCISSDIFHSIKQQAPLKSFFWVAKLKF